MWNVIALTLFASCLIHGAPALQRAALRERELGGIMHRPPITRALRDWRWLSGLVLGIAGGLMYLAATWRAGLSVTQPLLNFGLIVLVILSSLALREHLRPAGLLGIAMLTAMPPLIAAGRVSPAVLPEPASPTSQMLATLALLLGLLLMCLLAGARRPLAFALAGGICFALANIFIQHAMLAWQARDAMRESRPDDAVRLEAIAAAGLVAWALFQGAALVAMQGALRRVPAAVCQAGQVAVCTLACVVAGFVVFGQRPENPWAYAAGCVAGVLGGALSLRTPARALARSRRSRPSPLRYVLKKLGDLPDHNRVYLRHLGNIGWVLLHYRRSHSVSVPLYNVAVLHKISHKRARRTLERRTALLRERRNALLEQRVLDDASLDGVLSSLSAIMVVRESETSFIAIEGNGRLLALRGVFGPDDAIMIEVKLCDFRRPAHVLGLVRRTRALYFPEADGPRAGVDRE